MDFPLALEIYIFLDKSILYIETWPAASIAKR